MLSASLWQFVAIFSAGYILTRLLVPHNIRFSQRHNILAQPNDRSIHTVPVPTAGGLSFGLAIILLLVVLGFLNISTEYGGSLLKLAGISLLVVILGLFDDKYKSRARYKLMGQILVALLMFYAGYRVTYLTNPLGSHFQLQWLSLPITLAWFLMTMNAINLIDGLDGLAAGITCIVSIVLAIVGMISSNPLVMALAAILLGTNLAFLKYNFSPAKIFMGDTGSLLIGLNIAAISTAGNTTFKGITTMTMMVPVIVLAIPFIDTVLAVFRRIGRGSIFRADKAHLHHYLLKLGLSQKAIALITYFLTCLFGLAAIGFSFSSKKILFAIVVLMMAVLIMLTYYIIHWGQKK